MKGNGKNIQELTRIEAYLLSEKAGHPSHLHDYFWSQAESIVRQRIAIVDTAVKASGAIETKVKLPAKRKPAARVKKASDPQLPLLKEPTAATPVLKEPSSVAKKAVLAIGKAKTKAKLKLN